MTKKITVSLPDRLVEQAKEAVRAGRVDSVSAYVAAAMEYAAMAPTLKQLLEEWDEELGPIPEDVAAEADRRLEEAYRQAEVYYAERDRRAREDSA